MKMHNEPSCVKCARKKVIFFKRKGNYQSVSQFSRSVMVWLFVTPWTAAHQASCPSPTPGAYSNSCPFSWWCHPTISSSVISFSRLQSFPASGLFQWVSSLPESVLRWPKYWSSSFSMSPSNEYSGLIFFRMDWLYLLAFQGTFKSLLFMLMYGKINTIL